MTSAISYPLDLPTIIGANEAEWQPVDQVAVSRNPFNYITTTYVHSGDMWRVSVVLPEMPIAHASKWEAFLYSLRGKQGTFLMGDARRKAPRGVATGTPKTLGASVPTLGYITTDGWTHNTDDILLEGDMIQIDNSLYKVLKDADSDNSGVSQLEIWPSCRTHADNATIVTTSPRCLMRLTDPLFSVRETPDGTFVVSFAAEEVLT